MRSLRKVALALMASAFLSPCVRSQAQAALLLEEPYGFFGALNPTGHNAIYFERVCAETPVKLRRCEPHEMGAVIARYQGLGGYDWLAIPLMPYLYSVETAASVPERANRETVARLRSNYHETHLLNLGEGIRSGNMLHGGWQELVGVAYERRIYAFRFETTEAQDDEFIARMNGSENHSHFNLLFNNCADFARVTLDFYFPGIFKRSAFPDAGMTTPKQIAYKLLRYGNKQKATNITAFEIPQVPGNRRPSGKNKDIAESLITTGYAIPIAVLNPYLAGALVVDYLARGRYHISPNHPRVLRPVDLDELTSLDGANQNAATVNASSSGMSITVDEDMPSTAIANSISKENTAEHE